MENSSETDLSTLEAKPKSAFPSIRKCHLLDTEYKTVALVFTEESSVKALPRQATSIEISLERPALLTALSRELVGTHLHYRLAIVVCSTLDKRILFTN